MLFDAMRNLITDYDQSLGIHANSFHSGDIQEHEYRNTRFIVGLDGGKLYGLSLMGTNTKTSLMTVKLNTSDVNQANHFKLISLREQTLETNYAAVTIYP